MIITNNAIFKMKINLPFLLLIIIFTCNILQSCCIIKRGASKESATKYITEHIKNYDTISFNGELISKRKTLQIAKKNAYGIYGFWHLSLHEKPFKKHFIDRYLYLSGSLLKGRHGGVFWIVVDRMDGKVEEVCHGK